MMMKYLQSRMKKNPKNLRRRTKKIMRVILGGMMQTALKGK